MNEIAPKVFDAMIWAAIEETPIFNLVMEIRQDFLTEKSFDAFMKSMDQTIKNLKKMHESEDIYFLLNESKVTFEEAIEDIYNTVVIANPRHHPNAKEGA